MPKVMEGVQKGGPEMIQQMTELAALEMWEDEMSELTPEERVDFHTWCQDNQIEPV